MKKEDSKQASAKKEIEDAIRKEKEEVPDARLLEEKNALKADIAKKQKEIEDLTDMLKRVQAEFINYRNRTERDMQQCRAFAGEGIIRNLLPLLDSFDLALKATSNHDEFVKGMELIYAQLYAVLKQEGLTPIDCVGKPFDPYKHEVLLKEKSDKYPSDTVIEDLQKGYMLKDRIIRHSKVKISE